GGLTDGGQRTAADERRRRCVSRQVERENAAMRCVRRLRVGEPTPDGSREQGRRSDHAAGSAAAAAAAAAAQTHGSDFDSIDPLFHLLRVLPFSFLRPPRTRLRLPSNLALPSPMTVFSLILLTYFAVVSGLVYDVIVEPPGIGSAQDPATGAVRPVVFLPGRVNGQYIIEGLSSGFMFLLGGIGIILLDLAADRTRPRSLRVSFGGSGAVAVVIAYAMAMLFLRIKIPGYLW
uniref:Oligosaccharyltransferase complex subunit n=1 Tax=Setaria italica TaxID=4555 RepID=A0A0Q3RI70_SETIT